METIRVVMVDAQPQPGTHAFAEYGGASINVYTTELSEAVALRIATREVSEAGWQVNAIDETFLLTRGDLVDAPDGLAYFEQALMDGVVVVIHTYSATPDDTDRVH